MVGQRGAPHHASASTHAVGPRPGERRLRTTAGTAVPRAHVHLSRHTERLRFSRRLGHLLPRYHGQSTDSAHLGIPCSGRGDVEGAAGQLRDSVRLRLAGEPWTRSHS